MKLERFAYIIVGYLIMFLLSACASTFDPVHVTGIPMSLPDNQNITMRTILTQADRQVQKYVPGAYASSLIFLGEYKSLEQALGTINIGYVRVEQQPRLRSQVIVGMVSVNTLTQTMEMHFEDHSEHYPSTAPLPVLPESLPLFEVATLAHDHIDSLGLLDCDVTLTYLEDVWLAVCTESGAGPLGARKCKFEIDSTTLQILEP